MMSSKSSTASPFRSLLRHRTYVLGVTAVLALVGCGGGESFDADAARNVMSDRSAGMTVAEREDAVAAMKDACEGDNLEDGMAELVQSDLPSAIMDAFIAGCDGAGDVLADMDVGEVITDGRECDAVLQMTSVAIEAWYAMEEAGDLSSVEDLIAAGLMREGETLDGLVTVEEGDPSIAEPGPDC